jgi:small subunit ribosomal protein S20
MVQLTYKHRILLGFPVANHKSATKRARSAIVKRDHNSQYLASVRTSVKRFRFALEALKAGTEKDIKKVETLLSKAQEMLMKASSKGIVHKKAASRKVSRLALATKSVTGTKK